MKLTWSAIGRGSYRRRIRLRTHLRADRPRPFLVPALCLVCRADHDRDLSQVLVLVQELMRLGDPVEAHRLPEDGPDLALGHELIRAGALISVGEVRAEDLLLLHPQVADVEVEVVARGRAADDDLAERLDGEHRGWEGRLPDVLEDDVGRVAENSLYLLRKRAGDGEALLIRGGIGRRMVSVGAHHLAELVAVDVADGAE